MSLELQGAWYFLFQILLVLFPIVLLGHIAVMSWLVKEIIGLREFKAKTCTKLPAVEVAVSKLAEIVERKCVPCPAQHAGTCPLVVVGK